MIQPTPKHKEEARADLVDDILVVIEREGFSPDGKDWSARRDQRVRLKATITRHIDTALSSRNTQIREVLEGVKHRPHDCWCGTNLNQHSPACLAARELYDQVQPVKEELDVVK